MMAVTGDAPGSPAEHLPGDELYRPVVAAMREGVVVQDANGAIIACNASAERILGLTADHLTGLTSLDPRWRAVDENGLPIPGEQHPAIITQRTGQPQSNVVMG